MPVFAEVPDNFVFNAWVSPPNYTGLAPRVLDEQTVRDAKGRIEAPIGSTVILRLRGTSSRPTLDFAPHAGRRPAHFAKSDAGYEAKLELKVTSHISVRLGSHSFGDWYFVMIPDHAPTIAFTETPLGQQSERAEDRLQGDRRLRRRQSGRCIRPLDKARQAPKTADPLTVPTCRCSGEGQAVSDTPYRDLTANPYAGSKVHITLVATDAALGQTGESKPLTITLPHRVFTEPLAQALIEQRKDLALGGEAARPQARDVVADALTIGPDPTNSTRTITAPISAMRTLKYRLADAKRTIRAPRKPRISCGTWRSPSRKATLAFAARGSLAPRCSAN